MIAAASTITSTISQFQTRPVGQHPGGPLIGGNAPTAYGALQGTPTDPTALLLYVQGGAFATMMGYISTPLLYGNSLRTDWDVTVGADSANLLLLETDVIVTDAAGWSYNGSLQNLGGQLQIVDAKGAWVSIPGATPGMLKPGLHHMSHVLSWNPTTRLYGVQSITVDTITYTVPQALQNVAGSQHTPPWAPSGIFQAQVTLKDGLTAAQASVQVDNGTMAWTGLG
jgi:hypothetical protein